MIELAGIAIAVCCFGLALLLISALGRI